VKAIFKDSQEKCFAVYKEFETLKFNSNLYTSVGTPEDSKVAEEPNFLV